jgi:hypothetical protein
MIDSPPHFWAETVSTATYLINIQPSLAPQGGIPFERLCGKTPDYSSLRLFGCVCYVLLAPHERTKLTTQSVECVFLGWDPVARRMQISRDVVFDKSRPFYSCPSSYASPASLVDHLSFLLFPNASPASLPIPCSTLPSSVSSSKLPPVVLDYTVKPPVTQLYSHRGARLSDAPSSSDVLSSDVPSSPSVEPCSPVDSSLEQLIRCSHRLCFHNHCSFKSVCFCSHSNPLYSPSYPTFFRGTISCRLSFHALVLYSSRHIVIRDDNSGVGSGHPQVSDPTVASVGTILHPHPTRTEMGSGMGLVLHPRVTRRVPKKSPVIFFTRHPNGPAQLGAHLNAQAHASLCIL